MEVSGLGCFSSSSRSSLYDMAVVGDSSSRARKATRVFCYPSDYKDDGHLKYYYNCNYTKGFVRCGGNNSNKSSIKKKLKLAKSLFKDFSVLMADSQLHQAQAISLQETADALMQQLHELREKEKELKRQKKEEKKANRKSAVMLRSSESSSSSESSDSDCGEQEIISISSLTNDVVTVAQPVLPDFQQLTQQLPTSTPSTLPVQDLQALGSNPFIETASRPSTLVQKQCRVEPSSSASTPVTAAGEAPANRIEVCMGNKCKKSGGAALLEEFQRVLGLESAVIGCKCMGKCRDGPNVRVRNSLDQIPSYDSVTSQANPLCIGVGLKDVDTIVANFFREKIPV